MPEFSTVLKVFLDKLQPYRTCGYVKQEKVVDFNPEIYVGNKEIAFITIVDPLNGGVTYFEGFQNEWFPRNENIPKPVEGVLGLKVEMCDNKYYITGEDLNVVEIFYALPKAWHANEEVYYRVVRHIRDVQKRKVSYTNNAMNRRSMAHFQSCVNYVNENYKGEITNKLRSRTNNKIIGFTTEVIFPPKIQEVINRLNLKMPGKNGPVRFGKSGAYKYMFNIDGVYEDLLQEIYPVVCKIYKNVYCQYLSLDLEGGNAVVMFGYHLSEFIKSDTTIAGLTYGDINNKNYHARLLVKDGDIIKLYDPWIQGIKEKKIFEFLKSGIKKYNGYEFVKVDRPAEQTDIEGSCALNSLCRVITAAEGNVNKKDLEEWVPVFVQMLVKHFRGTAMEESIVKMSNLKF